MTWEKMKTEAGNRLADLCDIGFSWNAAADFWNFGTVSCCEKTGASPLSDYNEFIGEVVEGFQSQYGVLVYLVLYDEVFNVPYLTLLYVDGDADWIQDRMDLNKRFPFGCTINLHTGEEVWNNVNIEMSPTGGMSVIQAY